jgi:hypothetical protein
MRRTFSFNQLGEEAKQKVLERERFTNVDDYEWWADWIYEDLKEYGIETKQVFFDVHNRCFSVYKGEIDHEKMISCLWHKGYITVQQAYALRDDQIYISLKTSSVGGDHNYFVVESNDEVPDKVFDGLEAAMDSFIEDVASACLKKLDDDYEGLTSDESVIDTLMANDWRFTKDGERE